MTIVPVCDTVLRFIIFISRCPSPGFLQYGGIPVVPVGHFVIGLQSGGEPVVYGGHGVGVGVGVGVSLDSCSSGYV